ncbi:uncharacterized protein FPOAC1_013313 [Fusarium poae]|uniref:uncharacterized protein n=1 Tax=Fusarium poae TaxID=36050 RepID=UPI001D05C034|nr:uncharacterized protein FPOAC1_013313 [Fusarium poae]KAG8665334.1 hypothetical protein FPOAC1_013313 [Fusarium poae]
MMLTSRWNQQTSSARRPGSLRVNPATPPKVCAMKVAEPRNTWGQAPPLVLHQHIGEAACVAQPCHLPTPLRRLTAEPAIAPSSSSPKPEN